MQPATGDAGDLHPYVEHLFDTDPIRASSDGDQRGAGTLGDVGAAALDEAAAHRGAMLRAAADQPAAPVGTGDWLEQQVLRCELRRAVAEDEHQRPWQRAPYWYPERIGQALSGAFSLGDPERAGRSLTSRLREVSQYLAAAQANLTVDAPQEWAVMGARSAAGLQAFLQGAVATFAATLPAALACDVTSALPGATDAVAGFESFACDLAGRATGRWSAGSDYLDLLLQQVHLTDFDSASLAEMGREQVEIEARRLAGIAAEIAPGSDWREQIDRIKDDHPHPEEFLAAYRRAMDAVAKHTVCADLVSLPTGENCDMDWVPEYRRESLPLGEMVTSAPYAPGLDSRFLITPADPAATVQRRSQHARDNCHTFALSIAGHETYPGHHVQSVHHKLGTPRGSIRRFAASPQFVEGWGLYVEDLLQETGFRAGDGRMRLFKQRNALWRALRIVVDVGLHTGGIGVELATELLIRDAGMDPHMAAGEVRRYTRHDNPTYPSSYVLGRDGFHRVRNAARRRQGQAFSLRTFHDSVLSFGSPPLRLVETMMATAADPSAESPDAPGLSPERSAPSPDGGRVSPGRER